MIQMKPVILTTKMRCAKCKRVQMAGAIVSPERFRLRGYTGPFNACVCGASNWAEVDDSISVTPTEHDNAAIHLRGGKG
jgi:hypothetical protein